MIWLAAGAVDVAWLKLDTRPPTWDPFNHLLSEIRYRNILEDLAAGRIPPREGPRALLRVDDHYPPLAPLAAAVASAPFGRGPDAATLVLAQLALGILIVSVYAIGSALASRETGVIAAAAVATFPLIAGQSRQFMLDLPDAAMTSLAVLALLRAEGFRRARRSLLFGAVLGLALLTKWTCAFFVALPLAAAIGAAIGSPERRRRLALAAGALLLAGMIAAPWYLAHLWTLWRDTAKFAYAVGVREGDPPVWTLRSLLYYPSSLVGAVMTPWTALAAAGAALALLRDRRRIAPLFLWLAGGLTILTLIRNKDARYLIPMLPAVALLAATAIARLRPAAARASLAAALAAGGLVTAWRRDPPRDERWPVADAVSFLQSASRGRQRPRLRIVPDLPSFERHAFEFEAEARRFPLDVGTWFHFPAFADFVLTKTGEQGERPEAAAVMADIESPGGSFRSTFRPRWTRRLPDGSVATIWARDPEPVTETGTAVGARLSSAIREVLGRYASNVEGLTIAVEPASDEEARRGRFARIAVSLRSAIAHSRPNGRDALAVRDVSLEARDVSIDAPGLLRDGKIRLLALGEVLPAFTVAEDAVDRYLAARSPKGRFRVRFTAGRIEADGRWRSGPDVRLVVVPSIVPPDNIGWRIDRIRVGGIPLPGSPVEALLSGNDPLLKPMPCRVRLETLEVDRGILALNRPGARAAAARPGGDARTAR